MRAIFIIILGLLICEVSKAQEFESRLFSGNLLGQDNKKAIEYGALKNINTGETVLTDQDGYFQISGTAGDTLMFHSLGFEDHIWVVPGIWYTMQQEIELNVRERFYALDEVEVVRYYSYAHFKQAFKDLKLPEDENQQVKEMVNGWNFDEAIAWGAADRKAAEGTFGISLSAGGKDPLVLKREAIKELEDIQDKSQRFNYFTSRDNIQYLTSYEGTCLDSFMIFLNSQYSLSYQMAEYDLLATIINASKDFKLQNGFQEWFMESDSINVQ